MARSKTTKTRNALTYETLPALFTGICDAIRTKTGGTEAINHQDIPSVIETIGGGGGETHFTTTANPLSVTATMSGTLSATVAARGNPAYPADSTYLSVNGVKQTPARAFIGQSSQYGIYGWDNIAVNAGDTIVLSYGTVSEGYVGLIAIK